MLWVPHPQPFPWPGAVVLTRRGGAEGKTEDYPGFSLVRWLLMPTVLINKGAATLAGHVSLGLFRLSYKLGHIIGRRCLVEKCCVLLPSRQVACSHCR